MFRCCILLGFTFLFIHLHITGAIKKYINMKYSYLSFWSIFILLLLTIIQFYTWYKSEKGQLECADDCGHDHGQTIGERSLWKKIVIYCIFIFPIISGIFFPIATLDSNIVNAKGFHFPIYDDSDDGFSQHQFLRPDSSIYYGADGYKQLMEEQHKKYIAYDQIVLTDKNFLKGMETIYNDPGDFMDKRLQLDGFIFHDHDGVHNKMFVFRFGIIHCIADSGVFGILVEFPKNTNFKNDQWVRVKGKLSSIYYQPFKMTIPYLSVDQWETIPSPEDPYVYRW